MPENKSSWWLISQQKYTTMAGEAPTRPRREPSPRRCLKCRTEFVSDTYHLCPEHRKQASGSGYCFDVAYGYATPPPRGRFGTVSAQGRRGAAVV